MRQPTYRAVSWRSTHLAPRPRRNDFSKTSTINLREGRETSYAIGLKKPVSAIVHDGKLRQIAAGGTSFSIVHPEIVFTRLRGVSYDKTNRRVFVADSDGTSGRTIKIVPIDG